MFGYQASAFSKTQLRRVLSCESPAVFLHFPLKEKGPCLLSAPVGSSKRETPTSILTESTASMSCLCPITLRPCFSVMCLRLVENDSNVIC